MVWKQETELTQEQMEKRFQLEHFSPPEEEIRAILDDFMNEYKDDHFFIEHRQRVKKGKCSFCRKKEQVTIEFFKRYVCSQCLYDGMWIMHNDQRLRMELENAKEALQTPPNPLP